MRLTIPGLFLTLMLFMLGVSVADADTVRRDWMVVEVSGAVDIKDDSNNKLSTVAGTHLDAPFTVTTGGNGRAVVSHGQDRLTVGPDSSVTVPPAAPAESGVITRIRQMLGSVLYQVEHRIRDSFEVDTPYLVSVVKGTTFNIRVTPDDSTVALIEGSLYVHTPDMKSELMLKPGQAAIKSRLSKGIILKDQQSLSAPRKGPITVAKDGDAPASNTTTGTSRAGTSSRRDKDTEQSVATDISDMANMDRISTDGDINAMTRGSIVDLGTRVDGGNLVDLGSSVTSVSTSAAISSGSLVDLGTSVGDVSTTASIGSGSLIDLGASVGDVSTTTTIGGSSVIDLGAAVGNVSADATIGGGSVVDLGASVGDISASATVGGVSTDLSVGGSSLIDIGTGATGASTTLDAGSTTTTAAPTTTATTTTTTQVPILSPLISGTVALPGL